MATPGDTARVISAQQVLEQIRGLQRRLGEIAEQRTVVAQQLAAAEDRLAKVQPADRGWTIELSGIMVLASLYIVYATAPLMSFVVSDPAVTPFLPLSFTVALVLSGLVTGALLRRKHGRRSLVDRALLISVCLPCAGLLVFTFILLRQYTIGLGMTDLAQPVWLALLTAIGPAVGCAVGHYSETPQTMLVRRRVRGLRKVIGANRRRREVGDKKLAELERAYRRISGSWPPPSGGWDR